MGTTCFFHMNISHELKGWPYNNPHKNPPSTEGGKCICPKETKPTPNKNLLILHFEKPTSN